jgi:hypothetical protein
MCDSCKVNHAILNAIIPLGNPSYCLLDDPQITQNPFPEIIQLFVCLL